ncbi:MAG: hypothetical protein AAGE94_19845 [Acidobacteriota bacterium]
MRFTLALRLLLGALVGLAVSTAAEPVHGSIERLDRIVAVVDDDPILYSEIDRARAFRLDEGGNGTGDRALLDRLIEQRLRLHEVERHDLAPVPDAAVDRQVAAIEARLGGADPLDVALAGAALDRDALRERVRRQLRVLAFVEERLSARVFVTEEAVVDHYRAELVPEIEARGAEVPTLDVVREDIRRLIEERALAEEVDLWTDELRQRARIVDLLDRSLDVDTLPPLIERIEQVDGTQPPSRR